MWQTEQAIGMQIFPCMFSSLGQKFMHGTKGSYLWNLKKFSPVYIYIYIYCVSGHIYVCQTCPSILHLRIFHRKGLFFFFSTQPTIEQLLNIHPDQVFLQYVVGLDKWTLLLERAVEWLNRACCFLIQTWTGLVMAKKLAVSKGCSV